MLTIESKVVGRRRPIIPEFSIPVPPDAYSEGGSLTLRDVITLVVLSEVKAFQSRRQALRIPQLLTQAEISMGLASGKITSGARPEEITEQQVHPQAAVDAAILAFIDGLYYVFLDDVQQEDLDATVYLRQDSRLTFLRLVALVGG